MNDNRIKIKVKKKHKCGTCGKFFTKTGFYKKHIISCENLQKTKYQKDIFVEETQCLPSQKDMYKLLLDLTQKYETLNNEVQTLRKYVERTKKKINILDWLKDNCKQPLDFNEWIQSIEISDEQLENVFKYGYIDGMYLIIQKNLDMNTIENHPIKCFDQKKNIFYNYYDQSWKIMDQTDVTTFIREFNHKIMAKFLQWKQKHNEKIENNDRFYDTYIDYMKIVLGGNKTKEQSYKIITNKIYNYLKCDLKNIIQYEFVF